MKNLIVSALIAFGLMMAPVAAKAAESSDIGIVDVNYIMSESNAAKALQKQIKDQSEAFQAEFSKFERELKDMEAALTKARADKVSEEEFKKKRSEFEKKLADTQALFQKRRQGFEKGKAEAFKTLSESIFKETEKVAAEKKIKLVLAKSIVVIGAKEMDLTQAVFEGVNKNLKDVKLKVETN